MVSLYRPTAFQLVKAGLFTVNTETRPAGNASGPEFVSVELAFWCSETETKCEEPPQAYLSLELPAGRIVKEDFVPMAFPWMGAEAVVGGGDVKGWITFEIQEGAAPQLLWLLQNRDRMD